MTFSRTMMGTAAAAATMLVGAAALAQDGRLVIDQIGERALETVPPVQQIAPAARRVDTPAPATEAPSGPLPQLSSGAESRPATSQLTGSGQGARQPTQLYTGGRTAQPSEALSRPAQGRTGAVARVEGEDRCDPAANEERVRACERVIETRSAEFTRPDPTVLSPEQRLLVDQRLREAPATARSGARRLAATGTDAESEETQSVASMVLRPPSAPREEDPVAEQEATAAEAAAIVTAIINASNGTPRR